MWLKEAPFGDCHRNGATGMGHGSTGVRGQYTGYNAPDDNAYVERVIRTLKEEEIWPNAYDTLAEARTAIESYISYYNHDRIHSALGYRTPNEFAATHLTLGVRDTLGGGVGGR